MAISENQNPWSIPMPELERAMREPEKPAEAQELDAAFSEFQKQAPDFQRNPQNVAALCSYLPNRWPSAADFRQAHSLAIYEKRYNNEAPYALDPKDAYSVPLEKVHDAAFGIAPTTEWNTEMKDLAQQAGIGQGPQHDPAWSMDLTDLGKQAGVIDE